MTGTSAPLQGTFDTDTNKIRVDMSSFTGASGSVSQMCPNEVLMSKKCDSGRKPDTSVLQHAAEQLWSKIKVDSPPCNGGVNQSHTILANLVIITTSGKQSSVTNPPIPSGSIGSTIPIKLELLTKPTQEPAASQLTMTKNPGTNTRETADPLISNSADTIQATSVEGSLPTNAMETGALQLQSLVTPPTITATPGLSVKHEPTVEMSLSGTKSEPSVKQVADTTTGEVVQSTPTRTGQYTCWTCRQQFQSHTGLKRHNLALHVTQALPCDQCVKVFRHPNALADHKKRVHGPREYVCGVCSADFATESYLRTHVRIHEEKQFCCTECKHCFSNHTDLKNHMRVHNGEKPFTCEVCGKSFRHVSGFYAHIRIHTGETPYNCEQCEKKFSNASNYRMHMKVHTKEMRFRCETCGKEFIQPSNYSRHLRIHTKERPYACNLCSAQFPYSTSLKRHQQRDHGVDLLSCRVCSKTFLNETSLVRHRTGCELRACVTSTGAELCAQLL